METPTEPRKFYSPVHLELLFCATKPLMSYQGTILVKITYLPRVLTIDSK